jgi:energy-coupling factor transporter ATP-binding protein EcfA2
MAFIRSFKARNFRTLVELELDDLPNLVLLYGPNEAGKSNLVRAMQRALSTLGRFSPEDIYEGSRLRLDELETAEYRREFQLDVTKGNNDIELAVTLDNAEGSGHFSLSLSESSITLGQVIVQGSRLDQPSSRYDDHYRLLSSLSQCGFAICESERRFLRETLTFEAATSSGFSHPNGDNLKSVLFEAANSPDSKLRGKFRERFLPLCSSGPFKGVGAPTPALNKSREVSLLVEDLPIECRGSGYQQWVLIHGILTFSGAKIGAIEEPEAHLSAASQYEMAAALRQIVESETETQQLFVTSHSPHMIEASGSGVWFEVARVGTSTKVNRREDPQGLEKHFPEFHLNDAPDTPMRLDFGNVVKLSDSAVRHLNSSPGTYFYAAEDTEPVRSLRLIPSESMHEYLSRGE